MNLKAYEILNKYNLPIPKFHSLDSISSEDQDKKYYLRYSPNSKIMNEVVSGKDILNDKDVVKAMIKKKELLYIESSYKIEFGGAVLIKPNFQYLELVGGHPIVLLRRGLCAARIISNPTNHELKIIKTNQKWQASQSIGSYGYFPSFDPIENSFKASINQVMYHLSKIKHEGMILEWFATDDEVLFCDARNKGFQFFGNHLERLSEEQNEIVILDNSNKITMQHIDCFDIDFNQNIQRNDEAIAFNGSLLSHFITRHINLFSKIRLNLKLV